MQHLNYHLMYRLGPLLALATLSAAACGADAGSCDSVVCTQAGASRPASNAGTATATGASASLYGRTAVKPELLRELKRSGEREWKDNMMSRDGAAEAYDCALSVGIGGDLSTSGYKGLRLFGKTHTLSRPDGKGTQ
ncbi:MAG TPA: hypothetical protein DCW29_23690 [Janthinobacterium sp.]|nr:hypothetical protein [Janthinobacterium sp.]